MADPIFNFEVDEFEPAGLEPEDEVRRTRGAAPNRRPVRPVRPSRPVRPRRPPWRARRIVDSPILRTGVSACPTVLVLEGFGPASIELEPHHDAMLQRLAEFVASARPAVQSISVIGWSSASEPLGSVQARRVEKCSRRLEELLKGLNRPVPIRGSARSGPGPERVEVQLCN
ncbi:MAG: hypothetical protein J0H49_03595 [Acidobacteria bacterium]|nr:hypothetical protein [Acidobacteriota bacterium]